MKSKLALPVMVALIAVVALALPSAMAESGEYDAKYHKKHHKLVEVTDFVGSIQITEDADRHALKEQVSVTLSEAAANYPDAKKAKLGAVVNENGDKFVVWLVVEAEYDHETHTKTKYIHVIDAADSTNTTTVTKEIDHTEKIQKKIDRLDKKIDRISEKLETPSDNPDKDALKAQFLDVLTQLRDAIGDGDRDTAKDLREQLKDLRSQLTDMRRA